MTTEAVSICLRRLISTEAQIGVLCVHLEYILNGFKVQTTSAAIMQQLILFFVGWLGKVRAVQALPDGRLASASQDHTARIWVAKDGTAEGGAGTYYDIGGIHDAIGHLFCILIIKS